MWYFYMPGNPSFDRGNNKGCAVFSTMTGNSMHLLVTILLGDKGISFDLQFRSTVHNSRRGRAPGTRPGSWRSRSLTVSMQRQTGSGQVYKLPKPHSMLTSFSEVTLPKCSITSPHSNHQLHSIYFYKSVLSVMSLGMPLFHKEKSIIWMQKKKERLKLYSD